MESFSRSRYARVTNCQRALEYATVARSRSHRLALELSRATQYADVGQYLFAQGDEKPEKLYIVVEGRVCIERRKAASGQIELIGEHYPGSDQPRFFGERALWTWGTWGAEPRAASARAVEPTNLLVLHASRLADLTAAVPSFSEMLRASRSEV